MVQKLFQYKVSVHKWVDISYLVWEALLTKELPHLLAVLRTKEEKICSKRIIIFFFSWWISPVGSSPKAAQDRWCWESFPLAPAIEATSTLVLGSVSPEISFHHATLRLLNNLWRICLRRCNFATDINLCLNGASASSSNFDWDSLPKVFRTSSSSMSTYDALMALV